MEKEQSHLQGPAVSLLGGTVRDGGVAKVNGGQPVHNITEMFNFSTQWVFLKWSQIYQCLKENVPFYGDSGRNYI